MAAWVCDDDGRDSYHISGVWTDSDGKEDPGHAPPMIQPQQNVKRATS